jgi:carbamoyltransferase
MGEEVLMAQSRFARGRRGALILTFNGAFHELSVALMKGPRLLAFAEEERFTRVKKAKTPEIDNPDQLPLEALAYCLQTAGVTLRDVDLFGYSYDPDIPVLIPGDDVVAGGWGSPEGEAVFQERIRRVPGLVSDLAGTDITDRWRWVPHHFCHAGSAFWASPYDNAAVLSIDGRGEATTTLLGHGRGPTMQVLGEIGYPNSLGFLWEAISLVVGLHQFEGPGQLMGLAAWGNPARFANQMEKLLSSTPDGFQVDNSYTRFRLLERGVTAAGLEELFGPARRPGEPINTRDADLAAALQAATDRVLLDLAARLKAETGASALCVAGGVALNCVSLGQIVRQSGYDDVFVQPAAGDAGTSLGAALHLLHGEVGERDRWVMAHPYLGPAYTEDDMLAALRAAGLTYRWEEDIVGQTAELLAAGQLVGWYQGAAEIGPRALGNRSILGDPRDARMNDRINLHLKRRAHWRPMAPSILAEHAKDWVEVGARSPSHQTMNYTYPVRADKRQLIPAVVHADGHTRAQLVSADVNPLYHALISSFYQLTGVPLVVNTSFNGPAEPIVNTPAEAVATFLGSGLDVLVLGNLLVAGDDARHRWEA